MAHQGIFSTEEKMQGGCGSHGRRPLKHKRRARMASARLQAARAQAGLAALRHGTQP